MSHVMRMNFAGVTALVALCSGLDVAAETFGPVAAPLPAATAARPAPDAGLPPPVVATRPDPMGMRPLDARVLAGKRGAADVYNDMQLRGVVSDNRAVNVTTGSNVITEGAFSGAAGVPMVVQNSGNNVLIQNATILNIQLK